MWKATFKSLWSRKLRLGMSMLAIVLGVAFVSGSFVFSDMIRNSFSDIFESSTADIEVQRDRDATTTDLKAGTSPLDQSLVDKIAKVEGVQQAVGDVNAQGVVPIDRKGRAVASVGPPQLGVSWNDLPAYKGALGLHVFEGRKPTTKGEIALDPATFKKTGYRIGDRIKVITPEKGTLEFTIVGTAATGNGSTAGASLVIFTLEEAQELFLNGTKTFTGIRMSTAKDADRNAIAARVQKLVPEGYEARNGEDLAKELREGMAQGFGFLNTFLLIFAGISLVVATFLIVNTFTILVAQRSKELALFRSMGASKGQIMGTVLVEALVLGTVGSILGLLAGPAIALGIKGAMAVSGVWDIGHTRATLGVPGTVASLATGILVTLVAALSPARRATRIAPVEAMTAAKTEVDKGLGKRAAIGVAMFALGVGLVLVALFVLTSQEVIAAGVGMLLALLGVTIASPLLGRPVIWIVGKLYRALFGEVGKLAELNSVRQPRRTAATASALMIGLTLVSTMAIMGASADRSIEEQVSATVRGDFIISRTQFQPFSSEVGDKTEKVAQVEKVHRMKAASFMLMPEGVTKPTPDQVKNAKWFAVGATATDSVNQMLPQRIIEGRVYSAVNEMIIDEKTAKDSGLKIGSKETVMEPSTGRVLTFTVVGIYTADKGQVLTERWVSIETLRQVGLDKADAMLTVQLKPGADRTAAKTALDEALKDNPLVSVMDQNEYVESVKGPIQRIIGLLYALLGLSIVIAILGIINTLGLSIVERIRELGLLRAIALTRREVRRMITLESVVISLLGALVGVGMGVGFGFTLYRLMREQDITHLAIPWMQLGIFLLAAVLVGVLAALWPAHRAAQTNILKAIATD